MVEYAYSISSTFNSGDGPPDPETSLHRGAERLSSAALKRLIDILGASVALIVLSPLLALVAIIAAWDTAGFPVFCQRRTGLHGRVFIIYKFRSMRVCEDGDTIRQATRNDYRITGFGGFLRRTSIDELPQLFNVLKGDMSLSGPRPHALAHDQFYGAIVPHYHHRFLVKPGLTGLAQVSGLRGPTETIHAMSERVDADLEYIRRWSLWLDIKILIRTAVVFPTQPRAF